MKKVGKKCESAREEILRHNSTGQLSEREEVISGWWEIQKYPVFVYGELRFKKVCYFEEGVEASQLF